MILAAIYKKHRTDGASLCKSWTMNGKCDIVQGCAPCGDQMSFFDWNQQGNSRPVTKNRMNTADVSKCAERGTNHPSVAVPALWLRLTDQKSYDTIDYA